MPDFTKEVLFLILKKIICITVMLCSQKYAVSDGRGTVIIIRKNIVNLFFFKNNFVLNSI